jgi:dTDP-4-dehydrorhamnose reductase
VAVVLARPFPLARRRRAARDLPHDQRRECSWYEFARATLDVAGVSASVTPIPSATLAAPAPRPAYSVLANTRLAALGEPPLRHRRAALAAYLRDASTT